MVTEVGPDIGSQSTHEPVVGELELPQTRLTVGDGHVPVAPVRRDRDAVGLIDVVRSAVQRNALDGSAGRGIQLQGFVGEAGGDVEPLLGVRLGLAGRQPEEKNRRPGQKVGRRTFRPASRSDTYNLPLWSCGAHVQVRSVDAGDWKSQPVEPL